MLNPIVLNPLADTPVVSVLVANYNYARFIPDAVESVLAQTYANWELIICDDGSTDESPAVLRGIEERDSRIRALYKENGGQASAWNLAYEHSTGDIICLLDADDRFTPDKLEKVVKRFRADAQVGFILHPMTVVDDNDNPIQQIPFLSQFEHGWIADRVVQRGGRSRDMPSSALCFRREMAEQVFPIPAAEFRRFGDGYACMLLPLLTRVSSIHEPLTVYRVHETNARGSARIDLNTVLHDVEATVSQTAAVNRFLALPADNTEVLQLESNLNYHQNALLLALIRAEPRRHLLSRYASYVPILVRDDLYTWTQKVLGLLAYGVAILLPGFARQRWVSTVLGYNSLKRGVQRVLKKAPRLPLSRGERRNCLPPKRFGSLRGSLETVSNWCAVTARQRWK
jgi:glycosyltransferase involved in cell wall biosynthesis